MINKITLKGVASYKQEAVLETDKKINLIYGLNGSGKTILSNYLKNIDADEFQNCSIHDFNPDKQKILVYNQKFINEHFYESETQKGIFTLAQDNKEALKQIDKSGKKKEKLKNKLDDPESGYKKQLEDMETKIGQNKENAQEKTWEIKLKYTGGDRIFGKAGFLSRLMQKKKLFDYIKQRPLRETEKTIEGIRGKLLELTYDAREREKLSPVNIGSSSSIEKNHLFQKEIVGKKDSEVAELIEHLKNSDWVKKGIDDYVDLSKRKECPFCQQETLTEDLVESIKSYFDESYENDIKKVKGLEDKYQLLRNSLSENKYIKEFFSEEQRLRMREKFDGLVKILDKNLEEIKQKISTPSRNIGLDSSLEAIQNMNSYIETINNEIMNFNKRISNKESEIEKLKEDFWDILRKEYDPAIEGYRTREKELQREKEGIKAKVVEIEKFMEEQDKIIRREQKNVTNIDTVIEKINKHILDFGIQDFKIEKHGDKKYKIKRGEENETEFRSLSEGEKTVISFLYFVELCKGKETETDTKEKIIVIDDPVSSLSHMHVFNVAQLIETDIIQQNENAFLQVFILTHSLYFFNELIPRKKKSRNLKLFRISKSKFSIIQEMERNEIQNEYQSYWLIIKDGNQNSMPLVANAMRNIIEYFFAFVDKSTDIRSIFEKPELLSNKYQSFKRYIDRESHSDAMNISDYKEFNYEIFKKAFEKVFQTTGHKSHYQQMME